MAGQKVAVVGTGTIGAMALWQLASRGVDVTGYDRFAPGHDRGAAGGESRIFRVAYMEGPEYIPLLRRSRELFQEIERQVGRRLFFPSGFVTVGPTNHEKLENVRRAAREYGLDLEEYEAATAAAKVPEHPLLDGQSMLFDPQGGVMLPELTVALTGGLAEKSGATINRYTGVEDIQVGENGVRVVTDAGADDYDQVVIACGPWTKAFDLISHLPMEPKKLMATWFPRRSEEMFVLGKTPAGIRVANTPDEPGYSCFPSVDGSSVKVIPHGIFPDLDDPDDLPRAGDVPAVRRAVRFVSETLPGVIPDPVRVSVYSDAFTRDNHGYLGRLNGSPVVVAQGFSGHGFKLAPAFAEAIASIVVGEAAPYDVGFLNPDRVAQ